LPEASSFFIGETGNMILQCISALCTLGLVVLAILIVIQRVSLDDALKAVGKAVFLLVVLSFAACLIGPIVHTGFAALAVLLKAVVHWLLVAVIIAALLILFIRALRWKSTRSNVDRSRNGGEW
jgi:hypothetical protein